MVLLLLRASHGFLRRDRVPANPVAQYTPLAAPAPMFMAFSATDTSPSDSFSLQTPLSSYQASPQALASISLDHLMFNRRNFTHLLMNLQTLLLRTAIFSAVPRSSSIVFHFVTNFRSSTKTGTIRRHNNFSSKTRSNAFSTLASSALLKVLGLHNQLSQRNQTVVSAFVSTTELSTNKRFQMRIHFHASTTFFTNFTAPSTTPLWT